MRLFVDESGSFSGLGTSPSLSAVGVLVVPDATWPKVAAQYRRLRPHLNPERGEVKGSRLNEAQVSEVASILRRSDALFFCSCIDLENHSDSDVVQNQQEFAESVTRNLGPEHHASWHQWAERITGFALSQKVPQWVQASLNYDVLSRAADESILYFSQRRPRELGSFEWVVDAKEPSKTTDWEKWWLETIMPVMQARSHKRPAPFIVEGDYRHFKPFIQGSPVETPAVGDKAAILLRKLFSDVTFSAEPQAGLEMVDIMTNAIRRALVGHLKPEGWHPVSQLMIHRTQYVEMLSMKPPEPLKNRAYGPRHRAISIGGRPMVPAHRRARRIDQ